MDNREIALLLWFGVAAVFMARLPPVRASVRDLASAFLEPAILASTLALVANAGALIWVAQKVDLWTPDLWSETVVWFLGTGFILLINSGQAGDEPGFFRRIVRTTFAVTFLTEFLVNVFVLPLPLELVLLPAATALTCMAALADSDDKYAITRPIFQGALGVLGMGLLLYGCVHAATNWGGIDFAKQYRTLLLPAWLTLGVLPYIYVLGLASEHKRLAVRLEFHRSDGRVPWHIRRACLQKLNVRANRIDGLSGGWLGQLAAVETGREADLVIDRYLAWRMTSATANRLAGRSLLKYAGVAGTDERGRQLDQREFEATKEALRQIASGQEWRREADGYVAEMADLLAPYEGLPRDHGITLKVAYRRRAWFAWRQTVTGRYLGLGAGPSSEDLRYYDAETPPAGPPELAPGWGRRYDSGVPNW